MTPEESPEWAQHRRNLAEALMRLRGHLPEQAALAQFDDELLKYGREQEGFFQWWDQLSPTSQLKFTRAVWESAHLVVIKAQQSVTG